MKEKHAAFTHSMTLVLHISPAAHREAKFNQHHTGSEQIANLSITWAGAAEFKFQFTKRNELAAWECGMCFFFLEVEKANALLYEPIFLLIASYSKCHFDIHRCYSAAQLHLKVQ